MISCLSVQVVRGWPRVLVSLVSRFGFSATLVLRQICVGQMV